jgi:hypothetical protein
MPISVKEHAVHDPSWGNWKLEKDPIGFGDKPFLVHKPSYYRVDFGFMDTPAGLVDIIFQVVSKGFPAEDIGDFIKALEDLLAPQYQLGLNGSKSFNAEQYVIL